MGAVCLVVCGLVRDQGRKLQPNLWESWSGSPTVRRLRWRDASDVEGVRRLHARLNSILDEPLPGGAVEFADPAAADRRYDEAVAVLRERTRDTNRFRLVFAENKEYGFRRNSLGLRPYALAIAFIALGLSIAFVIHGNRDDSSTWTRWGVAGGISFACVLYWWFYVTSDWVRKAAELYADRLIESIDTLRS